MRGRAGRGSTFVGRGALLLSLGMLVACLAPGDDDVGTLMVRAGGFARFEHGTAGQYYKLENKGPGYVAIKDVGRPQNENFVLYPGHIVDMRGPMSLIFAAEGGQDAVLHYRRR